MLQGSMKRCYVHLERLPEHMIKNPFVKVDLKDLSDNINKDNVSHYFLFFFHSYL